tara:strand:+ start:143 stop:367 length:225 start_codon:yes stop_codon:yes gene_type:complete
MRRLLLKGRHAHLLHGLRFKSLRENANLFLNETAISQVWLRKDRDGIEKGRKQVQMIEIREEELREPREIRGKL